MTRLLDRTHLLALLRLTKPHQAFPGLIGPVCLMSKCHKAFIDKMPRVNVSQPLVRQALFLIGTNRMFLLTNKQGDLPSLRRWAFVLRLSLTWLLCKLSVVLETKLTDWLNQIHLRNPFICCRSFPPFNDWLTVDKKVCSTFSGVTKKVWWIRESI